MPGSSCFQWLRPFRFHFTPASTEVLRSQRPAVFPSTPRVAAPKSGLVRRPSRPIQYLCSDLALTFTKVALSK